MSGMFKDKVVLVTGGSRGIGKAIALAFAREEAQVVIAGRNVKALAKTLDEVGGLAVPCDVSDPASVKNLFQQIDEEMGAVDILINNAAIGYAKDFLEITPREFQEMMAININGVFYCSQEMIRRRQGKTSRSQIVNFSSLGGIQGTQKFKGLTHYVASKFAVIGLTESMAVEGADYGVVVNCVAPGAVDTEMLKKAAPHLKTQTRPEDVAQVVLDLCREAQTAGTTAKVVQIHSNIE